MLSVGKISVSGRYISEGTSRIVRLTLTSRTWNREQSGVVSRILKLSPKYLKPRESETIYYARKQSELTHEASKHKEEAAV